MGLWLIRSRSNACNSVHRDHRASLPERHIRERLTVGPPMKKVVALALLGVAGLILAAPLLVWLLYLVIAWLTGIRY